VLFILIQLFQRGTSRVSPQLPLIYPIQPNLSPQIPHPAFQKQNSITNSRFQPQTQHIPNHTQFTSLNTHLSPMPEYFDLLDPSTGLKTGHNELRSTVHKNGLHHACIHLWIFDIFKNTILDSEEANIGDVTTEVKVLLQRRSKAKESYPYFFDISSAGHLSSGENDFVCLTRELYEELGVLLDFELPPGVSQTELDEIWKGIYEHKNIDEHKPDHPDLQKAVVHAQYIYNTTFLSVKPDTKAMMEYNVTISTSANPTFYESTTLYFCGKFWQYNVVGKDYIDNELATIFFLKGFFRTQEQINCEEKNDNIENDNF